MSAYLALAFAAAIAGHSPSKPPPTFPMQTIRIVPLPMDRAFAVFRKVCFDSFPDPAAVKGAVAALDLGYEQDAIDKPGRIDWTSPHGDLRFDSEDAMADGQPMQQCDLRFASKEQLSEPELVEAIESALASGRSRIDQNGSSFWELGLGDFSDRLEYRPASADTRYFSLVRRRILQDRGTAAE